MKNRLEDEYRQLMQNETPDLWERISASIDAKIAANNEAKEEITNETEKAAGVLVSMEVERPVKNKKRDVSFWKKYSLPLVACIAAILCVPLMLTGFLRMASGGAKSESAAADMAVAEESYSTTTEAEAEASDEAYFEEAVVEEEAAAEDAPAEAPESVMSEETTEGAIDNFAQDKTADSMVEDAEAETESNELQAAEAEKELLDLEKENEELTLVLTVTTISAEEEVLGEERAKGTIYYLTTEEEGACTVFVPSDLAFVIDQSRQIKIVVEKGNDDYDYVFVKMAE